MMDLLSFYGSHFGTGIISLGLCVLVVWHHSQARRVVLNWYCISKFGCRKLSRVGLPEGSGIIRQGVCGLPVSGSHTTTL